MTTTKTLNQAVETYLGTAAAHTALMVKPIRKQAGIPESIRCRTVIDSDHRARDLTIRDDDGEILGFGPGEVRIPPSHAPEELIMATERQPRLRDIAEALRALPKGAMTSTARGSGGHPKLTDVIGMFCHQEWREGYEASVRRARAPETQRLAEAGGITINSAASAFVSITTANLCGGFGSAAVKRFGVIQANALTLFNLAQSERPLIAFLPALSPLGDEQTVQDNFIASLGEILVAMTAPDKVGLRMADGSVVRPEIAPYTTIWTVSRDSAAHSLSREAAFAAAAHLIVRLADESGTRAAMRSWEQDAGSDRAVNAARVGPLVFARWGVAVAQVDAAWCLKRAGAHIRRRLAHSARVGA